MNRLITDQYRPHDTVSDRSVLVILVGENGITYTPTERVEKSLE